MTSARVDVLEQQPGNFVGSLDQWAVANLMQHDFAHLPTMRPPALEHCACLRYLRLRRKDIDTWPIGYGAKLSERSKIEHRLIAHHLVLVATDPQQRRGSIDVAKGAGVAPGW